MISYKTTSSIEDAKMVYPMLLDLDRYYPDFSNWYLYKVIPNLQNSDDFIIMAEDHHQIVGVILVKKGEEEKLRCIRVKPEYISKGIGCQLIDRALMKLSTDKPCVSVSQELIHDYSKIFVNRYDFLLDDVQRNIYREKKLEYFFNSKIKKE